MQKILTIVIPTYDMQDYINRCLDSLIVEPVLMEQLEVLVVNDGSKDQSSAIAHQYQDNYSNTFRVIDKENGNYGSCVNRGLAEAQGKYIKILDADDRFDTIAFSKYLNALRGFDVDMVLTPFKTINETDKRECLVSQNMSDGVCVKFDSFVQGPSMNLVRYSMHMVTYRTEFLRGIGYKQTEGISYTDTEWTHIPQYSIDKFVYLSYPIYLYTVGRVGQTMDAHVLARNIWKYEQICQSLIENKKLHLGEKQGIADRFNLEQIVFLSQNIYKMFLVLTKPSDADLLHLKQFDDYLKQSCEDAYVITDKLTIKKRVPIYYVRYWRRTGKRFSLDWLRDLYRRVRYGKNYLN